MLHFFIIYFRYEIGDGQSYLLPDVIADFSNVKVGTVNEEVIQEGKYFVLR